MTPESNRGAASEPDADRINTLLSNTIRDIGIPPCPTILNRINVEIGKDEPDFKYLDRIICSDVGLAAGLIAVANSPFFGFRSRVRSVHEALLMLGLNVASRAIAGLILRKLFPSSPSLDRFWHSSASIARLGGWLAQNSRLGIKVKPDDAYTFGLFRDCGIPILIKRFPQYPAVLKQANEEKEQSFTVVEETHFPTNHGAVGCLLAQSWWLPDDISLAIRHHHDKALVEQGGTRKLPATTLGLIATAQLAEHLFQHHTGLSKTEEWHKHGASCLSLLRISEEDLPLLYDESGPIACSEQ